MAFGPTVGLALALAMGTTGCRNTQKAEASEKAAEKVAAPSPPAASSSAPATVPCPTTGESFLTQEQLDDAARDLAKHPTRRVGAIAAALNATCKPTDPGFAHALAAAIARFELRTLPFTHEVDGKLDDRTSRFLEMFYPSTRRADHACSASMTGESGTILSPAQVARGSKQDTSTLSKVWMRVLEVSLGRTHGSGRLDEDTLQRIARWQKLVHVVEPRVRPNGLLDAPTLAALRNAYPRLRRPDPTLSAPLGYLPACVAQWKGATREQLSFMVRVYETQRIWAAQRRSFVGTTDAAPIEQGRTAQKDAAARAIGLLAAARASAADPKQRHHGGDLQVVFGYRSSAVQVAIWEYHFPSRYEATQPRRAKLADGPHGLEAVVDMAKYYAARTAAPGYSLHNRGMALDLACVDRKKRTIGPTGRFIPAWERSWCLSWLEEHAARFGFHQNPKINEPWHWEYHPPG